ncbi:UNVERIFIED_CONTAM: hypothetical protein Sangu_0701500 [Sesamum angustifolium]|uniref:Uncharacterized protein n=1 Tax=Sesamum angustifolium TaxID=2727405 RepID=A0AAW2PUM6_9LAMI
MPQQEHAKVDDPNLKLTPDRKSQPLVYDRTKVDGPSSKLNSSRTSSRIEFKHEFVIARVEEPRNISGKELDEDKNRSLPH